MNEERIFHRITRLYSLEKCGTQVPKHSHKKPLSLERLISTMKKEEEAAKAILVQFDEYPVKTCDKTFP